MQGRPKVIKRHSDRLCQRLVPKAVMLKGVAHSKPSPLPPRDGNGEKAEVYNPDACIVIAVYRRSARDRLRRRPTRHS